MSRIIFAFLLTSLVALGPARADVKPDFGAIVKDLEVVDKSSDRLTLVFWMPLEFWRATLESSGKLSDKGMQQFVQTVQPYTILAVLDGETGLGGAINYAQPDALRASVTLEDTGGNVYQPLALDKIDEGLNNLLQMMRPVLSSTMGPMGAHMEFLVFTSTSKVGKHFVDVRTDGALIVHVGPKTFRYRLPLGSFLEPVVDVKTGETFPGNYHFNPFTGSPLSNPAGAKATPTKSK